jgi:hypothetical protein
MASPAQGPELPSLVEFEQRVEHRHRGLGRAAHERVDVAALDRLNEHDPGAVDVPAAPGDGPLGGFAPPWRAVGNGYRTTHVVS